MDQADAQPAEQPHASSLSLREAGVLVLAVFLLGITYYHGTPACVAPRLQLFFWVGGNLLLLLAVPLALIRFCWREPLSRYGLAVGDVRVWSRWLLVFLAIMVPIILIASRMSSLQAFYPRYAWARESASAFWASSAAWVIYFLAWEFFFRGFLLNVFLRRYSPAVAIAIQTVPFAMMHFPKPEIEALASIVAGIALGYMAYRGRSMLGPWLLHWLCAFLLDVLVIAWPISP